MIAPGILPIHLSGSHQNPAWSPDGSKIVFTRFRRGYNNGPADVMIYDLSTKEVHAIVADGSDNVSQPGSTWNKTTGEIIFSSDSNRHDEIWAWNNRTGARKITSRDGLMAYEPSWSPDGQSIVFESHRIDEEDHGRIVIRHADGTYEFLTQYPSQDCRQPNWSPAGGSIVYQRLLGGRWDLWIMDVMSRGSRLLTAHLPGDKTDATFSPDGTRILYSGERPGGSDGLLVIPVAGGHPTAVQHGPGYYGAASWSPDGLWIAAETSPDDPDDGPGTKLTIIKSP